MRPNFSNATETKLLLACELLHLQSKLGCIYSQENIVNGTVEQRQNIVEQRAVYFLMNEVTKRLLTTLNVS